VTYKLYENYAAGATAAVPGAVPGTLSVIPPLPAPAGQRTADQVLAPVPSQQLPVATVANTLPAGITSQVYSVVQSWAQDDGRAPVLRMAAAVIPAEYAGMYDIITNVWDRHLESNPTQVEFWNALRGKYDPGPPADQIW
jgi:hypothetical protein